MKFISTAIVLSVLLVSNASAQDAQEGAALYASQCATCHGLDGKGGGPMAPALILQPPNLVELRARNAGVFPTIRVVMRIDGRDPLVSHGSPMPVYGDFFDGNDTPVKAETGQPIMTNRPTADLLAYLKTIQE